MVIGVGRSVIDSASCNLFQRSGVLKTKLPHVSITFHCGLEQSLQGTQSEIIPQSHICCIQAISTYDRVDGRNPAPPEMYKTQIMGQTTYQLVQDFFHQQYTEKITLSITLCTWQFFNAPWTCARQMTTLNAFWCKFGGSHLFPKRHPFKKTQHLSPSTPTNSTNQLNQSQPTQPTPTPIDVFPRNKLQI